MATTKALFSVLLAVLMNIAPRRDANLFADAQCIMEPQAFLEPHNAARDQVGVERLVWNHTVAAYAFSYAATQVGRCLPLTHSHGPLYGENLFWGSGKAWTPADAVTFWVNEGQDYDHASNTCAARKVCGHYTQVVWSTTKSLGCASVLCDDGANYIICSYYPPGNWIGEPPY